MECELRPGAIKGIISLEGNSPFRSSSCALTDVGWLHLTKLN